MAKTEIALVNSDADRVHFATADISIVELVEQTLQLLMDKVFAQEEKLA